MGREAAVEGLRVDRWLWRTRFYKTRTQAAAAVQGGRVHVNGARAKSARAIRVGDVLQISHGRGKYRLTVLAIPHRRGPGAEAAACYRTDELVPESGERAQRGSHDQMAAPAKRPDKRSRRRLRALKGRS